jgi:hypothetical protein
MALQITQDLEMQFTVPLSTSDNFSSLLVQNVFLQACIACALVPVPQHTACVGSSAIHPVEENKGMRIRDRRVIHAYSFSFASQASIIYLCIRSLFSL